MTEVKKDREAHTAEDIASSVNDYFDDDVNSRIEEMTTKEMESILRDFINSREWIAFLKYNSLRRPLLDGGVPGNKSTRWAALA